MFERFTADARAVVVQAQQHARRLGHGYVGCEHLLLAAALGETSAGAALRRLGVTAPAVEKALLNAVGSPSGALDRDALAAIGIDLDLVRQRVEAVFGLQALVRAPERRRWGRRRSCRSRSGHLPFTPRAKRCLEQSLREALALGDRHIGSEHIALALAATPGGVAPQILRTLAVPPASIREAVHGGARRAG